MLSRAAIHLSVIVVSARSFRAILFILSVRNSGYPIIEQRKSSVSLFPNPDNLRAPMTTPATTDAAKDRAKHTRIFWTISIVCVLLLVAAFGFVDFKALHGWSQKLPGPMVFVLMALAPVFGAPVSILWLIGGARFGAAGGLVAVTGSIAVNLLLTYWITKSVLRKPIAAFFKNSKYKIPQVPKGEQIPISMLTALVPGLPYFAKNYLLVLAGVSFPVYFWVLLLSHFINASFLILFGGMSGDLTTGKIIFLIGYGAVLTLLCKRVINRLRARAAERVKALEQAKENVAASKS